MRDSPSRARMKTSGGVKGTLALLTIAVSLLSTPAMADSESLSFRRTPSGEIEAVVSGLLTNECGFRFLAPTSVTIVGGSIAIVSPNIPPLPCFTPIVPPRPYEIVANLGLLPASSYAVTWTQGPTVLSAQLSPADLAPVAVPTLGQYALILTALALGWIGAGTVKRRRA